MTRLPNTLHGLLTAALNDMEAIERTPGYVLDMFDWHTRTSNGNCAVCMAGATMARRLDARQDAWLEPEDFGDDSEKLYAIDAMRGGYFFDAFDSAFPEWELTAHGSAALDQCEALVVPAYNRDDGRAPTKVYRQCAAIMREAGL